jgi:hypothetical protein
MYWFSVSRKKEFVIERLLNFFARENWRLA